MKCFRTFESKLWQVKQSSEWIVHTSLFLQIHVTRCFFHSEEPSDEYQTDYDEEAVESALSDFDEFTPGSESREGEESVDTSETVR